MVTGLLGKKVGMTQIFETDGTCVPITVIEAGPCVVQDVKTEEKNGYNAVQLGYESVKESRLKKPQREDIKKKNLKYMRFVREIRCEDVADIEVGQEIDAALFQKGDYLDISGLTKGKGFQGGMKRCGWSGGVATHGNMSHRRPGSIGASSYPSKVDRGHPMPGQMGNQKVTIQNLKVVDVDKENGLVSVRDAVPGANGTYVVLKFAKKKPVAPREVVEDIKEETEEGNKE